MLLTGTPLQNSIEELFSLLNFLHPQQFNSSSKLSLEVLDKWEYFSRISRTIWSVQDRGAGHKAARDSQADDAKKTKGRRGKVPHSKRRDHH